MKRHHITLGAPTSAGGTVVSASSLRTIDGITVAVEGDEITCPSCRGMGHIVCDGPRIPETWNGVSIALENDFCVCGCSPPPRLLPSQHSSYQEVGGENGRASAYATYSSFAEAASTFNDAFRLLDKNSGQPLIHCEYAIHRADGSIEYGVTDSSGCTHLIGDSGSQESVRIEVGDWESADE